MKIDHQSGDQYPSGGKDDSRKEHHRTHDTRNDQKCQRKEKRHQRPRRKQSGTRIPQKSRETLFQRQLPVRFLAAYVESVNKMTAAISDKSSPEYAEVIRVAKDKVTLPNELTNEQKEQAIVDAFGLVVYKYADSTDKNVADPLADLKKDIASLAQDLYAGNLIKNSYKDLGFDSVDALAEKFVQSQYIKDAMSYEKASSYDSTVKIKVAVIGGDIHQLAIHYGIDQKIFESYGVSVELSSQLNGPAVYTAIHNGDCQFGFIGAPPMTINTMNAKEITA